MNVHVIDRDPAARSLLKGFLEKRGVRVTESADLEGAARIVSGRPPAAIVTDLDGSVAHTVEGVRGIAPGARVVIWTSVGDPSVRWDARRLGCSFARKSSSVGEVAFELARVVPDHRPAVASHLPPLASGTPPRARRPDARAV